MSISTRSQSRNPPMTPPQSHSGDLQEGFQQLIQHNASTSFPAQNQNQSQQQSNYSNTFDTDDDALSSAPSSFGSSYHPSPEEDASFYEAPTESGSPFSYNNGDQTGLGMNYSGQGSPTTPMKRETPYGTVVDDDSIYGYGTPAMSPPPSNMSTPDIMRTRSGQIINRPIHNLRPSRPSPAYSRSASPAPKATPKKRVKKEKVKAENKMAKLERPLSVLTAAWTHVPVVDIEAYVNRPASVRRAEVETGKTPGKVKRPMNSFMLYRKAYQNRTKNWCLQNNHQVVSQVCGDSWPLEPKEVREKFEMWAKLERANHQNAHPGYKFSPSKAGSKAAAKRKAEESDEESVLSDYDWQSGSRSGSRKRQQLTPKRTPGPSAPNQFHSTPYYTHSAPGSREPSVGPGMGGPMGNGYLDSMYQTHNPGRPAPPQYHSGLEEGNNGAYWQQQIRRNGQVEDVIMRRANAGGYSEQQFHDSFYGSPTPQGQGYNVKQEVKIDPSLMSADGGYEFAPGDFHDAGFEFESGQWPQQQQQVGMDRPLQEEYPEYLTQGGLNETLHLPLGQEGWQVESLEAGDEFNKWAEGP